MASNQKFLTVVPGFNDLQNDVLNNVAQWRLQLFTAARAPHKQC